MCTTAAKRLDSSWYLIKTRDPVEWMRWDDEMKLFDTKADRFRKLIVQNPEPHEDGYYGGINEKGVAFISTFVPVAENQVSYIRRPYVRLILEAATAKEAVTIIKSFIPKIGGNMFVADATECYGIEGAPDEYFIEKIKQPTVKTNHYIHLPYPNLGFATDAHYESWSKTHKARAEELLKSVQSVDDLKQLLQDRKHADKGMAICTTTAEEKCCTYSAFIFDTKNKTAYYCQGNPLEKPFIKFGFDRMG